MFLLTSAAWGFTTFSADFDDGTGQDAVAGDDIYTAVIPAQTNRTLVRYRIIAEDDLDNLIQVPYNDDPSFNFAYFVYDGVPPWMGAIRPGAGGSQGQVVEYGTEVMSSLPVYHLISKKSDVENCTWFEQYMGSEYKCQGVEMRNHHSLGISGRTGSE